MRPYLSAKFTDMSSHVSFIEVTTMLVPPVCHEEELDVGALVEQQN